VFPVPLEHAQSGAGVGLAFVGEEEHQRTAGNERIVQAAQHAVHLVAVVDPVIPVRAATFWYPPVSGAPSPASAAELALERALAPHEWARGRCWNYRYEWHPLAQPYRLDIFWPTECLVVEVDGDDHRERLKFADDRRRDVQLHQLGQVVARFTNEDVLRDVQGVLRKIESLLIRRRTADG